MVRTTVGEAGPKSRHTGLKVSRTLNRANQPSHLRRFKRPRGAPPPHCPTPHPGPASQLCPGTAPGAGRPATAGPARLGRGPGGRRPRAPSRAPGGPGPTGGGRSPEGPVRTGARRQRKRAFEQKPTGRQRVPPASASRSRSVFSNPLVLTRPRLLPPPGNQGPSPAAPRSRDRGPQPRAAGEAGVGEVGPAPRRRGSAGSPPRSGKPSGESSGSEDKAWR